MYVCIYVYVCICTDLSCWVVAFLSRSLSHQHNFVLIAKRFGHSTVALVSGIHIHYTQQLKYTHTENCRRQTKKGGKRERQTVKKDRHACMEMQQVLAAARNEAVVGCRQSAALSVDGVGLTPNVPRLQDTPLALSIAAIQHRGLGPCDGVSSEDGVLGDCRQVDVRIPPGPVVLLDAMVQSPSSLPHVCHWTVRTRDAVDHASSFFRTDDVFSPGQDVPQ